jgi:hypothetical protein
MGEGKVERPLRLSLVPVLPSGDLAQEPIDQLASGLCMREMQEDVPSEGQIISPQHETLNVGWVQLTHCDRPS